MITSTFCMPPESAPRRNDSSGAKGACTWDELSVDSANYKRLSAASKSALRDDRIAEAAGAIRAIADVSRYFAETLAVLPSVAAVMNGAGTGASTSIIERTDLAPDAGRGGRTWAGVTRLAANGSLSPFRLKEELSAPM